MKRRDFLIGATSSTSLLYLNPVSAAVPCPPILSGAPQATCSAIDAEQDYQSRISGPGVVWHHNFQNEAEVNLYRGSSGHADVSGALFDGSCRHITSDGVTGGGCLEIEIPTGGQAGMQWIRPFSPLTGATNGRGEDDPGADGLVTALDWNIVDNTAYVGKWKNGVYSHKDYWDHPTRGSGGGWGSDGDEFYIQFRVKIEGTRTTAGNPEGKLAGILLTGNGTSHITPNQEIVFQAARNEGLASVYTNFGNRSNSILWERQGAGNGASFINGNPFGVGGDRQPGGDPLSCPYPGTANSTNCSSFPMDEWVTVLVYVKAGHDGGNGDGPILYDSDGNPINPANDTTFRMWMAGANDTNYFKVYDKTDYVWSFGENDPTPYGWSAFKPWGYMNGVPAVEGWYHRYDEIIFSKEFIPCPQV